MRSSESTDDFVVDAVIPVHSDERPIARAVASLFDGNRTKTRAIVVAHNIDPERIRQALGSWADDARVMLTHVDDGMPSPSGPMNHGLDKATATFVTRLDSDDTLEPGALDRWVRIANDSKNPADFVIGNQADLFGSSSAVPPVRIGRRVRLQGAKDRLSYRAAFRGLLRRSVFGDLRFPEGVVTGEDISFSNKVWFSNRSVSFAFGRPGYLLHDDQDQRITTSSRSINEEFMWAHEVLGEHQMWMQNSKDRRAVVVKILRKNVLDALGNRLPEDWDQSAAKEMQALLVQIFDLEPDSFGYLSRSEAAVISALLQGDRSTARLGTLFGNATRIRSLSSLLPVLLRHTFSPQAPLSYHFAGRALVSDENRRNRHSSDSVVKVHKPSVRKKILVVTTWFPTESQAGYSFIVRDVELLARDHDVTVLHLCQPSAVVSAGELRTVKASQSGDLHFDVVTVPFAYSSPQLTFRAAHTIADLSRQADIVHTMALHSLLPTRLAKPKIPWVHTEHSASFVTDPESLRSRLSLEVIKRQLRGPDVVVAVGRELAQALQRFAKETPIVVGNYVRPIADVHQSESTGIHIVGVGNIIPEKGPDLFVEAVAKLRDRGREVQATWVGEGRDLEAVRSLARELHVDGCIQFLGQVPPEDVAGTLRQATLFMLPTLSETYGVAIAEALSAGLPIIVTGKGEFRSFLPENASRHVTSRGSNALADAVEQLVDDPQTWSRERIQTYARDLFSEEKRRLQYGEVYTRAVEKFGETT